MTITILRGAVRDVPVSSSPAQHPAAGMERAQGLTAGTQQAAQVARGAAHSEAVITAFRVRQGTEAGRVKDFKEAKSVAREVADKVIYEGGGVDAHSRLSQVASPEHFAD